MDFAKPRCRDFGIVRQRQAGQNVPARACSSFLAAGFCTVHRTFWQFLGITDCFSAREMEEGKRRVFLYAAGVCRIKRAAAFLCRRFARVQRKRIVPGCPEFVLYAAKISKTPCSAVDFSAWIYYTLFDTNDLNKKRGIKWQITRKRNGMRKRLP